MKTLVIGLLLGLVVLTCGCECVGGFGRDLQQAGHWIEHTADQARK